MATRRSGEAAPDALFLAHELDVRWIESADAIMQERYGWYAEHGLAYEPEVFAWLRDAIGPDTPVDVHLRAGERIRLGPRLTVEVLHLPGHTPGHVGLWDPASGTAIVIDAVMGRGLLDTEYRVIHPPPYFDVAGYLGAARALQALAPRRLLTAHYDVIEGEQVDRFLGETIAFVEDAGRIVEDALTEAGELTLPGVLALGDAELGPFTSMPNELAGSLRAHLRELVRQGRAKEDRFRPTLDNREQRRRHVMELGIISSIWFDTPVGRLEGIRKAKEIGFDTYDIFEDPLDITDAEREEIKAACEEAGLPIRSVVCVAFGIVDFNPSVRRFTLDRIKAYVDQGAYLGARNVLLVVGEYYWDGEVFPRTAIWDMAKDLVKEAGEYAHAKGLEIVLELEPFNEALLKDVHELVRFVKEIDHPAVRANADISHLHLSDCSFDDVALMTGLIGHIHLSDCDGKVHGDMPAGHGRDADQGVPCGDPRHGLRRHRLDRARVRAEPGRDRRLGTEGLRRHGRDHGRARRARLGDDDGRDRSAHGPRPAAEDGLRHRLHRRRVHHEGHPSRRLRRRQGSTSSPWRRARRPTRRQRPPSAAWQRCTTPGRSFSTTSGSRSSTSRFRRISSSTSSARR